METWPSLLALIAVLPLFLIIILIFSSKKMPWGFLFSAARYEKKFADAISAYGPCPWCKTLFVWGPETAPHLATCPGFLRYFGGGKRVGLKCPRCERIAIAESATDLAGEVECSVSHLADWMGAKYVGELFVTCPNCSERMVIVPISGSKHFFSDDYGSSNHPRVALRIVEPKEWHSKIPPKKRQLKIESMFSNLTEGYELLGIFRGNSLDDVSRCIAYRTWKEQFHDAPSEEQLTWIGEIGKVVITAIALNALWEFIKWQVSRYFESLEKDKKPERLVNEALKLDRNQFERFIQLLYEKIGSQFRTLRKLGIPVPPLDGAQLFCTNCNAKLPFDTEKCPNCGRELIHNDW